MRVGLTVLLLALCAISSSCSRARTVSSGPAVRAVLRHSFSPDAAVLREVAFSPDGRWLATTSVNGMVRLWSVPAWTRGPEVQNGAGIASVAFGRDSRTVVTGAYDGRVRVWNIDDHLLTRTLSGHDGTVWSVAVSPDGMWIASSGEDKAVRVWRASDGAALRTLTGHTLNVWCVRFSPDGRYLASGSFDRTARLWRASDGALERTLTGHRAAIVHLAFSPDGARLATGGDDSTIKVWDLRAQADARTLDAGNHVYGLTFSPDGRWIVAGGREKGSIGTLWKQIAGHRFLSRGPTVRIYRASDGALVQPIADADGDVVSVAVSPDGRWLAAASEDGVVRIWQVAGG